ncbi:MAG: energy coupling factor transporter S component ThiW [Lachnospiraceae bacterium]|nr:energy coupling factor transporter S component ThiW [Lachnospiraceae bacterium]
MKTNRYLRKMVAAAMLAALAVACSPLSIPVGASKCFPAQHLINVIAGIFLGPWYATAAAFVASLCRNLMGTGTLLAFPGSMIGAFLCGLLYRRFRRTLAGCAGELFGTSVLGGIGAFFVASLVMGKEAAFFAYVPAFFLSSLGGTLLAALLVPAVRRAGIERLLEDENHVRNKVG